MEIKVESTYFRILTANSALIQSAVQATTERWN